MPESTAAQDFTELLAIYLEKSEQCRGYWKAHALMAIFPSMLVGLRSDYMKQYRELEILSEKLLALKSRDMDASIAEIPALPDKEDPFQICKNDLI